MALKEIILFHFIFHSFSLNVKSLKVQFTWSDSNTVLLSDMTGTYSTNSPFSPVLSCHVFISPCLSSLNSHPLSFSHATIHLCDSWARVGARGPMGPWPLHLCNFRSRSHDEDSSETPEEPAVQAAGQPPSLPAQHDSEVCWSIRKALMSTDVKIFIPGGILKHWFQNLNNLKGSPGHWRDKNEKTSLLHNL